MVPENPLTFDLEGRVVNIVLDGADTDQQLVLKLVIQQQENEDTDGLMQQCEIFQLVVQPFVKQAMSTLCHTSLVTVRQQQLPRILASLFLKKTFAHTYTFFSSVRDLQVSKVPIFCRLKSYQKIAQVRRAEIEEYANVVGYGAEAETEYRKRSKIHDIYRDLFDKLNMFGLRIKHEYF
jgi:hypothetical protein